MAEPIEWTTPGGISHRLHVETWDGLGPHHQRLAEPKDLAAAGYVRASQPAPDAALELARELAEVKRLLENERARIVNHDKAMAALMERHSATVEAANADKALLIEAKADAERGWAEVARLDEERVALLNLERVCRNPGRLGATGSISVALSAVADVRLRQREAQINAAREAEPCDRGVEPAELNHLDQLCSDPECDSPRNESGSCAEHGPDGDPAPKVEQAAGQLSNPLRAGLTFRILGRRDHITDCWEVELVDGDKNPGGYVPRAELVEALRKWDPSCCGSLAGLAGELERAKGRP